MLQRGFSVRNFAFQIGVTFHTIFSPLCEMNSDLFAVQLPLPSIAQYLQMGYDQVLWV